MTQNSTSMPTVKVSRRFQVALPSVARRQLGIEPGDRLLVDVQDGMLVLLPFPQDMVEHLAGLHRDLWAGIDTTTYLAEERASWND